MAALPGTNIAAKVVPFDSLDTYATHDEFYGRGSYRTVADLIDRDAISTPRRKEGMLVYVLLTDTTYQLHGGITNANWRVYSTGAGSSTIYGVVECDTSSFSYVVSNSRIGPDAVINVTMKIPSITAVHYHCSVTEVVSGSFSIVLSDVPEVSGYYLNWAIQNPT